MKRIPLDAPVIRSPRRAQRDTSPRVLPDGVEHGTRYAYDRYDCRCDDCTDACALDSRRHLAVKRGELAPVERVLAGRKHGTISSYNQSCCRCDDCKRAARDHRAKYRVRDRANDPRRQVEPTVDCVFCGEAILWGKGGAGLVSHEAACQRRRSAA